MSSSSVSSSSSTVLNHRSPPLQTTTKGLSPPPPPQSHSPRNNSITRDTPNSTLAAMLADALSDAESYKRKYTEEKRRADYFEKLSEAFKQAVVEAKPNPAAPSSSPIMNKPASPSTTPTGAAQPSQPANSPTDPGSTPAASNQSNTMLADPKSLSDLIEQLSQDAYRASCARDDEHARRLCIASLWKQLRDYLDLLDVQSKQAREALDKRVEMGGGDMLEVQRAELVEVQNAQLPALRDVATFTRVYDENGRETVNIIPNSTGHSPTVLRKEIKSHHSHSQSHGRRPRSGSLEPPPDGYPPHKRSRNQASLSIAYPASNPNYPPQPQQIYLDPSPMPGYVGSPVFHEYQPLPPQHQPHPPAANSPPKKHQHIQPQPNTGAPQPPYYSTFHSRSDTQTQRGRPPAPSSSSSSRKRERSPEYSTYDGYPPQAMAPPPPPTPQERRERRERRRSRSRSVSSDRSLDEMLLDATAGDEAQTPNGTQLPPIRYAGSGKGDRRDYPYPQNQLPPPQLPPPPQGRTMYPHPPPPPPPAVNGRYRSPSPRSSDRERDRANSGGSTSSGYFTSVLGKTSNSKGRSPPASGPGDRSVLILDKASKSLPAIGTVEERGDRGGVVNAPETLHLHPTHPPPHSSSSQSQGSLSQPPPQGYPPTNSAGQRICRQCGQPGRYKEGKCVEKWGPGPWGPGTVCDRCRKKMKRVERRGTLEQAQMLAAKQAEQARANAALANSQHNLGSPPNHLQRSDTVPNMAPSRDASFVYSSQSQATVEASGSARGTPSRSRRTSPSPPQQQLAPPRTIVPAPLPRVSPRPPSSHSHAGSRHSQSGGSVDADADADADGSADGDDATSAHDDVDRAVSAAAGVDDDKQEKGGEVEEDLLEAIDAAESQAMKDE
uniref:Uncharacterized protein n=1 Tax=Moniliophthora roreri TaxID=221103 RepID=A0A0W0EY89_MONRR